MYLLHFCASTVFQNRENPVTSWDFVVGFTLRLRNSFNSCQTFSMGFMSGDSGGVFHQFIDSLSKKPFATREVCYGSLSCMKR